MSCPKCEEARLAGKKFCSQCGERLIFDEPAPQPERTEWSGSYTEPAAPAPEHTQWSGSYTEPAAPAPEHSQWSGVAAPPPPQPEPQPEPVHTYTPPETTGAYTAPVAEPPKKKKKNIPAIAAICALVALIAAAAVLYFTGVISFGGDKDDDTKAKDDSEPSASVAPSDEPEPSEEPEAKGTYTIGETVLADNDICRVTLLEVTEDDEAVSFELKLENTSDDPYTISVGIDALEEYELRDFVTNVSADLNGGASATRTLKVEKETMEIYDFEQLDKVTLNVYATDDPDADSVVYQVDEYIDVWPTGMSPSRFSRPDRVRFQDESVVYDDNDVLFMVCAPDVDSDNDYSFVTYAENDRGERVMLALDDITVNGVPYDDYFVSACGGGHAVYEMFWFTEAELAEMGLTPEEVETVSFTFAVYDWDTLDEIGTVTYTIGG